ncbi:MAG: RNA polymerase subunit sigma [Deltaproteobacteria bacterium]|nr:RNA polymerase subunit sigma [Deltaproteobacteria bacterium]
MSAGDPTALIADLAARANALVLVVTGAGVSLASGIPTFRGSDPDAVWSKDVTELGTNGYFQRDPAGSWRWYLSRFDRAHGALPNDGHRALAALERWQLARGGTFLLVTQNVDLLHEQAGSRELVKVHGSVDRVRCSRQSCELGAPRGSIARADVDIAPFLADPVDANVPRCPVCRARLRQHVLWFDEYYTGHADYQFERVRQAANRASLVLFVGTSFAVGVTDLVLTRARQNRVPVYSIDPAGESPDLRVRVVRAYAEVVLPKVAAALGA